MSICVLSGRPLFAADTQTPTIRGISPAPDSAVSDFSQITIVFSEPVVGVQAADLQVNGEPAAQVSATGATNYLFTFTQPLPGSVSVSWDADNSITDLAGNLFDPFAPGGIWRYTLSDFVAPAVVRQAPLAGATIAGLTQIEVVFSEAVSGVNAADLLVNGQAASSVTQVQSDTYRFQFASPAPGAVNVTWAGNHGIRDSAATPNGFGGAGWSYTVNAAAASGDIVINEILAENLNSLVDEDNQKHDWIELFNRGANSVDLLGWSLTDDPAEPGKWTLPAITLGPGQYLVVYASGKDRKSTAGIPHTNFRLNLGGGYLGLYNAEFPRTVVSEFGQYPEQRSDIAYGRAEAGGLAYFSRPTPGGANGAGAGISGFTQAPHASVNSGFFDQPFNVVLSSETPGAVIRYTLNGSMPTPASQLYMGPIPVAGTSNKAVVTIRAAAFRTGLLPSTVTTRTYIFPDHVLTQPARPEGFPTIWDSPCTLGLNCNDINPADYEMDPQVITNVANNYRALARQGLVSIPTVSIVTDVDYLFGKAEGVYVRREPFLRKPVNAEFITADGSPGFQIDCGLEMQGQTSPDDSSTGGSKWKSLKLGLRLFFQGEYGPTKLNYKVFDDSPVDSFDTLMLAGGHNNYWNYNNNDIQRTRAMYVRDQFVADLQNATGGLAHHGRFVHLYLNGLYWGLYQMHERPDASFQASYQGGEKEDYDVFKHDSGQMVDGSNASYRDMWTIINAGLTNNANYERVQQVLDVPDLINYMLVNFWANNTDWAHKNLYASHGKQGGKWRFHAWDSEHVIAATDYDALNDNDGTNPGAIFNRLLNNNEFRVLLGDHIHKHFFNGGIFYTDPANPIYNPAFPERNRPAHRFMQMLQEIDTAIVCESARWGDVGPGRETNPHTRNGSFYEERDILMGYRATFGNHSPVFFPGRSTNLINQFRTRRWYPTVAAPSFAQHGGRVPAGFNLFISNLATNAQIYYTTNGVDPRVYGSGAIAPSAVQFSGSSIQLSQSVVIKARALSGTNWSALNEAQFTVAELGLPLRFTEIMYKPKGSDSDTFEYIELKNIGATPLELGGYRMEGVNFTFPAGASLSPGALMLLASDNNPTQFAARYPGVAVFGYFGGDLDNGGERIAVTRGDGVTLVSVTYDDENGWPTEADGTGPSLEVIDPHGDLDDPANWRVSGSGNGTPGLPGGPAPISNVILNEVAAENVSRVANAGAYPDWVELFNRGAQAVDISNWSLSDDGNARKFVFPANTSLAVGAFLVVWCDTNNVMPGLHTGFALDRDGDRLFLFDASTNRVDGISFGLQLADSSIGRVEGEWQLTIPTPNARNTPATVASPANLAINEWLANAITGASDWVEIFNRSTSLPVTLRNLHIGTTNDLFQIGALSFLPPQGYLQLFADEMPGPDHLNFKLDASGDALALFDGAGELLERVTFGPQMEGVSQGRLPDGASTLASFSNPTPEASNQQVTTSGPGINEVLAKNFGAVTNVDGTIADFVELYNPGDAPWACAGWSLSVDSPQVGQWLLPTGLVVAARSFVVVWCDNNRPATPPSQTANLNTGRAINRDSGAVYLYDSAGRLADSVQFGFQVADKSIGRSEGAWRLLSNPTPGLVNSGAAILGDPALLRFNEWMASPREGDDWFELHNPSAAPVDLSGLFLSDDPSVAGRTNHLIAPLSFIAPGGLVLWLADGNASNGRNHVNFSLNALGETLRLYQTNLTLIDAVDFGFQADGISEGRLPDGASAILNFPFSPTPGASNYRPLAGAVINEAISHTDAPLEDAIEIFNPTANPVAIGGWFLSDNAGDLKKFRIPANIILPPGGFKVFYESDFNGGTGSLTPFTLDSVRGDAVILSEADGAGVLTGYRALAVFGAAENGIAFGHQSTSIGPDFTAMSARTFGVDNPSTVTQFRTGTGAANAAPKIGPIAINELMFHPPGSAGTDNSVDEFIELHNVTTNPVALFHPTSSSNTWRLRGGVEFEFPANLTLGSRAFLLVVNFDPAANPAALAAFRARYGVASTVGIHGPYRGKLGNEGDLVQLLKPDQPQGAGPNQGFVPYIVVDRVSYQSQPPWPSGASATGASLQRRRPFAYGNDPVNWKTEIATAGRANVHNSDFTDTDSDGLPDSWEAAAGLQSNNAGDAAQDLDGDGQSNYEEYFNETNPSILSSRLVPPAITESPQSQVVASGTNVTFQVAATGTAPLNYQWRFNGREIPGATNALLRLLNVYSGNSGEYAATVFNNAGFAVSSKATLAVSPLLITTNPQSQTVSNNANATFTVAASGTGPLSYQWRFNGADIPGATSSTLALTRVGFTNMGEYTVVVADSIGAIVSEPAMLVVLVAPVIVEQPASQTVATGSTVTFTVGATGTPPLGYRWRRNNVNISFKIGDPTLTITNVQAAHAGSYTVIVTNSVLSAGVTSAAAVLTLGNPPVITQAPTNQTVEAGGNATFNVTATGTTPLSYLWKFNNQPIANATNATLALSNVQTVNQGNYTVTVSNVVGVVTSPVAVLTVQSLGPVLSNPKMLATGQFRMELSGQPNRTYEIQYSATALSWTPLTNVLYTGGSMVITNDLPPSTPKRFYRARLVP